MSNIRNFTARLDRLIARRIAAIEPFRAIVDEVEDGMVRLHRLEAASAERELRTRIPGWHLAPGDEVICLPVAGKPVILGPLQRGEIVSNGPEIGTAIAASSPGTVVGKYEVFDSDGASLGWVPIYSAIS